MKEVDIDRYKCEECGLIYKDKNIIKNVKLGAGNTSHAILR